MKDIMLDRNQSRSEVIEAQLAQALRGMHEAEGTFIDPAAAVPQPDSDGYSANELLQLAYDSVENEIEVLRKELRQLRQAHRAQEDRVERRILQKEALRRKIVDSAAESPVTSAG